MIDDPSDPAARGGDDPVFAMMRRLSPLDDSQYLAGVLAYHAAPTLGGIKPASLLRPVSRTRDFRAALPSAAAFLRASFDVEVAHLSDSGPGRLLLIYNGGRVAECFECPGAVDIFEEAGYRPARPPTPEAIIGQIAERCRGGAFPHEIGVVLGYPPDDVRCFIRGETGNARCAGCWRSNLDPERSARSMRRFRRAKRTVAKILAENGFVADLVRDGLRRGVVA